MQKIVVALDGLNYKESATEYALSLAGRLHSHLVGVFLHDKTYHSYRIYDMDNDGMMTAEELKAAEAKDVALRKKSVQAFEQACTLHRTRHTTRVNKDIALPGLIHESIYADLLVINSGEQFTHYPRKRPSDFIRGLLEMIQCPVILTPDVVLPPNKAVLLYDGTPGSVYAIRMFCACMAGYKLSVEVLAVNKPDQSLHLADNKLLKEYLKRHFPEAVFTVVQGDANLKITAALKKEKPGTLVVLGAYKRGIVSRWFRPSMADTLLSTLKLPLFIAHST